MDKISFVSQFFLLWETLPYLYNQSDPVQIQKNY